MDFSLGLGGHKQNVLEPEGLLAVVNSGEGAGAAEGVSRALASGATAEARLVALMSLEEAVAVGRERDNLALGFPRKLLTRGCAAG